MASRDAVVSAAMRTPVHTPIADRFLFGASVYPENLTRDRWLAMLDLFVEARMTVLRLGESAWGALEPQKNAYAFDWLRRALDDMEGRGLRAILGTNSYIAPMWLHVEHPDMAMRTESGAPIHPMFRKAASLCHPGYREASGRFLAAMGHAFRDHPAVIGWQLDNEIDADAVLRPDYNPHAERAWTAWLQRRFGSVEAMNASLGLHHWGLAAPTFEAVPQPRTQKTDSAQLSALTLANLYFRRDVIAEFLLEQAAILREAGVETWLMTNWMTNWTSPVDDPKLHDTLDFAGLNVYPIGPDRVRFWRDKSWHLDAARSAHGRGAFLITETRFGVTGTSEMLDPFPSEAEFRLWMMQMVAFGASGLIYWSGHRWHGGHWPHWGAVVSWSGEPEPDIAWVRDLGALFDRWGQTLLAHPVAISAAVITDFDQRAALQAYRHTPASADLMPQAFELLHRLGLGAEALAPEVAARAGQLDGHDVIIVAAAPTVGGDALVLALTQAAERGATIIIGPMTAYQTSDGVFHWDGPGHPLEALAGAATRALRRLGGLDDPDRLAVGVDGLGENVTLLIDGYCELLTPGPETDVVARLTAEDAVISGQAVVTRRRLGTGEVFRLGIWPDAATLGRLLSARRHHALTAILPADMRLAPRTDGSLFLINNAREPRRIPLVQPMRDRFGAGDAAADAVLPPYGVLWLEAVT